MFRRSEVGLRCRNSLNFGGIFNEETIMARKKNAKGFCGERILEVLEQNLCDYFKGKRRNSKPLCRNCVHFHLIEGSTNKTKKNSVT